MKRPDLSRDIYSGFDALAHVCDSAHSGPELASSVPHPALAQNLAKELLSDQFELTRSAFSSNLGGALSGGFTIGLARR